jgi:hypothetical protein
MYRLHPAITSEKNDQTLQKLLYEMSYNFLLISAINIFQLSKGVNDNYYCFIPYLEIGLLKEEVLLLYKRKNSIFCVVM